MGSLRSCGRGFTLVELSIVLVILGLLVGGVLAGQSLIHASQLRAVTTEFNTYNTALSAFKEKYQYLPGDLPTAVRYWGAAAGGTEDGPDATCGDLSTPSTDQTTCNGDGNGSIDDNGNSPEHQRAWQHMANAGVISGQFDGIGESGGALIGANAPASKYPNAGWALANFSQAAIYFCYNVVYGNNLTFGANSGIDALWNPVLTPADAYNLDVKMDDGKPGSGTVLSYMSGASNTPNCVTSDSTAYNLTDQNTDCALIFLTNY